jgi:glycosyltransferase involved in cell wall biosynthesis
VNIVYDLRYATDHFPGIGTHAHALLHALISAPGDDRFRVLWGERDLTTRFDPAAFARHERVDWVTVREPSLGALAPLGTGRVLRRVGGDVYFSPFYLKPVGAPMPAVLTLHDATHLAPGTGSPWALRMKFAIALRHTRGAAAVITSSEFSRRELIRRAGFSPERLHVVPLGTPPAMAATPERPAGAPQKPFALVVGVNRPHKNLDLLFHAWRLLGDARPLELVAVGPVDPRFPSVDQLAREAGVSGTHTLGLVPPAQLDWLYANATLLLFPSRYEGFGFPLLEAAAHGTPVIASDIPALRELGDGVARFVDPADAPAWAGAIRELAADAAERARMRELGQALAARHDYAEVARRTLEILAPLARRAAA